MTLQTMSASGKTGPDIIQKSLKSLGLDTGSRSDRPVSGLADVSHKVKEGYLFVALQGSLTHGAHYAGDAVRRGAAAILTDEAGARIIKAEQAIAKADIIVRSNPRSELARLASNWHEHVPETMVAVTGTNGKTSVSVMCRQIWEQLGITAANLGTTGIGGSFSAAVNLTTPDPLTLHELLGTMAGSGVTHLAMEASSHGLDQSRLDGLAFECAAFTNLSHDHLDYHGTVERYARAKQILFDRLLAGNGTGVIWMHDAFSTQMIKAVDNGRRKIIRVGSKQGDLKILGQQFSKTGQDLRFNWQGRTYECRIGLLGSFQAHNLLLAAGLAIGSGCTPDEVFSTFDTITTIPGRMDCVAVCDNMSALIVDYAHTPAALETALAQLRNHFQGRLHVVFGAGGDRDRTKRVVMGRVAAAGADCVYVTDDNPRNEDPGAIRKEIMAGCPDATEIGDRAEAILVAASRLDQGDALLIAGKGHETGQVIGHTTIPFNDTEQASMVAKLLDGKGI